MCWWGEGCTWSRHLVSHYQSGNNDCYFRPSAVNSFAVASAPLACPFNQTIFVSITFFWMIPFPHNVFRYNIYVYILLRRYIAVTHPIFYSKHKNDKRVIVTIILVWMASSGVGLPIMLGANTSPERVRFTTTNKLTSCLVAVRLIKKYNSSFSCRRRRCASSTTVISSSTLHCGHSMCPAL